MLHVGVYFHYQAKCRKMSDTGKAFVGRGSVAEGSYMFSCRVVYLGYRVSIVYVVVILNYGSCDDCGHVW